MEKLHLAYVRVSTQEQAESGLGLEAQVSKIKSHAEIYDRSLAQIVHDDGVSAKNLDRPGIQQILQMVAKGQVASVTVLKLDRLSRSILDTANIVELFQKHDVALIAVQESLDTSTPSGRMMIGILSTFAQFERETISSRIKDALAARKARGESLGINLTTDAQKAGRKVIADRARAEREKAYPRAKFLQGKGLTIREIATELKISVSFAHRVLTEK